MNFFKTKKIYIFNGYETRSKNWAKKVAKIGETAIAAAAKVGIKVYGPEITYCDLLGATAYLGGGVISGDCHQNQYNMRRMAFNDMGHILPLAGEWRTSSREDGFSSGNYEVVELELPVSFDYPIFYYSRYTDAMVGYYDKAENSVSLTIYMNGRVSNQTSPEIHIPQTLAIHSSNGLVDMG